MRRVKMFGIPKNLAAVFAAYAEGRGESLSTFATRTMASEIRRHARGERGTRWVAILNAIENDALERLDPNQTA